MDNIDRLSPVDDRYFNQVRELNDFFTEKALVKYRLNIEILYLIFFYRTVVNRKFNHKINTSLIDILNGFDNDAFYEVKEFEKKTKHDVKAVEYFIKSRMNGDLSELKAYVHFGLTSEDVNNLAYSLILKSVNNKIIVPELLKLKNRIAKAAQKYKRSVMIGRTHGQRAVPTTMGKELGNFVIRMDKYISVLSSFKFLGKLNGAVGNYNSLAFTYPSINWIDKSRGFVENLGLVWNPMTTQIEPFDSATDYFYNLKKINLILTGFCQDIWRYVSDGYFYVTVRREETGSSTMPQKANPFRFENAEGNLKVANTFFDLFINSFSVSRLQRDLSDSTIKRNIGVSLAHSLLAYKMIDEGLENLKLNTEKISADLDGDYSVLSEALQLELKKQGDDMAYDRIKNLIRGHDLTRMQYLSLVEKLNLSRQLKFKLQNLKPKDYIGLSVKLVEKYV